MGKKSKKKRRRLIIKRVIGILACVALVVLFLLFAYYLTSIYDDIRGTRSNAPEGEVVVRVESGDSTRAVASRLAEEGVIRFEDVFILSAKLAGVDTKLQVGKYTFSYTDSYSEIFEALQVSSARESIRLTFAEGIEVSQIIKTLVNNGIGSEERFYMIISSWDFGYDYLPAAGTENRLEGYLFPDTYDFYLDESEESVIQRFLDNFNSKIVKTGILEKCEEKGRSLHDVIILASMIQKEGARKDFGLISSVFYNRLATGMRLESDTTINYLLPMEERRASSTAANLNIESPYNTYKYRGLPPTAIANPGYYAILAAVDPTDSGYYYFCSDGAGGTVFAVTLEEHELNVRTYLG